jgi:predicted DNA-binding protein YlxM (UPF0122 family)
MNGLSDLMTVGIQRHVMTFVLCEFVKSCVLIVMTVREIAEECNISIGSCHDILTTKSEMHWAVSMFVPRLLTQDQRDSRTAIYQELLDGASEDENFLKRIITDDGTWVYGYNVETKMRSS